MSPLDISTKNKIIETTLKLIESKPLQLITVREIAKSAGVNLAAINYYFGSKDMLLKEVSEYYFSQSDQVFAILARETIPAQERLTEFCTAFMRLTMKYPGLIRNTVSQYLLESKPRPEVEKCVQAEIGLIKKTILEISPNIDEQTAVFKAIQLYSGLMYPMLMYQYGPSILKKSIVNEDVIQDYVRVLLK